MKIILFNAIYKIYILIISLQFLLKLYSNDLLLVPLKILNSKNIFTPIILPFTEINKLFNII